MMDPWRFWSAEEEEAAHLRDCEILRYSATKFALFHIPTDKQVSKSHWHREVAVIEAYELGLMDMARGERWLNPAYEIREV